MKESKGKNFEDLISWINKCLHQNAEIIPNCKMTDKDTGKLRQIDILIKLSDGPTTSIGIIEVRDRSRKVGVEYIEQVLSKKNSVGADFAIIVSKMGFYGSALKKAIKNNLRTFTFEEALSTNWSKAVSKEFKIVSISVKSENTTIYFVEKESNKIIDPSVNLINQLKLNGMKSLVLLNANRQPDKSIENLLELLNSKLALDRSIPFGKSNSVNLRVFLSLKLKGNEKIYFYTREEEFKEVEYLCFIGEFWREKKEIQHQIHHFGNSDKVYADVISAELSYQKVDIFLENPNDLSVDKKVIIRSKKTV